MNERNRKQYLKGEKVRDIHTGKIYTVRRDGYWQSYAGNDTSDYTIELESIEKDQPTPWNKSCNLEPVEMSPYDHWEKWVTALSKCRGYDIATHGRNTSLPVTSCPCTYCKKMAGNQPFA